MASAVMNDDPQTNHRRLDLSARDTQVIRLIVQGFSNREIANALSISIQTVKHRCSHIYDRVGVSNRLELVLLAAHDQILNPIVTAASSPSMSSST